MKFAKKDINKIKITATIALFLLVIILILVFKNNNEQKLQFQGSIIDSLIIKNAAELKLVVRRLNIVTRRLNMLSVISEQNNLTENKLQINKIAQEVNVIYLALKKYQYTAADEKTTKDLESEMAMNKFDNIDKLQQNLGQNEEYALVGDNITLASVLSLDSELREVAEEIDSINTEINVLEEKIYLAQNITNIYSNIIKGKPVTHADRTVSNNNLISTNPVVINKPATVTKTTVTNVVSIPAIIEQKPVVQQQSIVKTQPVKKPNSNTVSHQSKPAANTITKQAKQSKSTKPAKKDSKVTKLSKNKTTNKVTTSPSSNEIAKTSTATAVISTANKEKSLTQQKQQSEPSSSSNAQASEQKISTFSKIYPTETKQQIDDTDQIRADTEKNENNTGTIKSTASTIVYQPSDFILNDDDDTNDHYLHDDVDDEDNISVDDDMTGN